MADNDPICRLKRSNHCEQMMQEFRILLRDELLIDCQLMCSDGQCLKAHRTVLSAASTFFKNAFTQMSNQCQNMPMIYLKDMSKTEVKAIIEFIYNGEITVNESELKSVLKTAKSLHISGLEEIAKRNDISFCKKRKRETCAQNSNKSSVNAIDSSDEQIDDKSDETLESYHTSSETPTRLSNGCDHQNPLDKTLFESRKSDILVNETIEGDHWNRHNGCGDEELREIDEIPDSLDDYSDNRERNELQFDEEQDEEDVIDSKFVRNLNLEFNEQINGKQKELDVTEDEDKDIVELDSGPQSGYASDKKKKIVKPSQEKIISFNSKELPKKTIQTIDLDGSPVSPVKLKVKTIGPPVRAKAARKKLDGFACKECEDYYRSKNLTEEELKNKLNICSRHRSKWSPPKSPEHFWDTDIPSTPECIRRGYMNIAKEEKSPFVTERKKRK